MLRIKDSYMSRIKSWLNVLKIQLMLVILYGVASCATTTGINAGFSALESVCALWQPVTWADEDSDLTIAEVKVNNARRDAFCDGVE